MEIKITREKSAFEVSLDGEENMLIHAMECGAAEIYLKCIDRTRMTLDEFLEDFTFNVRQWVANAQKGEGHE